MYQIVKHFPLYLNKEDISDMLVHSFQYKGNNSFEITKFDESKSGYQKLEIMRQERLMPIVLPSKFGIMLKPRRLMHSVKVGTKLWEFSNYDQYRQSLAHFFNFTVDTDTEGVFYFAPKVQMSLNLYLASIDLFAERCCVAGIAY